MFFFFFFFFASGSHLGYHNTFRHCVFLASFVTWPFLRLFCFWWQILRSTSKIFCRYFFSVLCFCHELAEFMGFGKDPGIKFYSHHIILRVHTSNIDVGLIFWLVFARSLHYKVILSPVFLSYTLWNEIPMYSLYLKSILLFPFIQSCWTYFILLVIIQFYLFCLVANVFPALALQGILVGTIDIFLLSWDFVIEHFLAFWSYKILQEHLFTPCLSPRFRMILVTKMWLLGVSTVFNISDDSKEIYEISIK